MTEKEEVKRIVDKYNKSITELMTKGTILEVKQCSNILQTRRTLNSESWSA